MAFEKYTPSSRSARGLKLVRNTNPWAITISAELKRKLELQEKDEVVLFIDRPGHKIGIAKATNPSPHNVAHHKGRIPCAALARDILSDSMDMEYDESEGIYVGICHFKDGSNGTI